MTDSALNEMEKFIREDLLNLIPTDSSKEDFFGPFAKNPKRFFFLPGHRHLIKELALHVKQTVDQNGLKYFNVSTKLNEIANENESHTEEKSTTRAHYFLNKLKTVADQNATRKKGGYRYEKDIQLFSIYLRIIVGKLAYQTLQSNLEAALPSLPTVDRYIRSSHFQIIPGVLRTGELLQYLNERNLPKMVSISEDMTRIINRVQYDSRTNQLYGFVEPINRQTGMPIPCCFPARFCEEIIRHFMKGTVSNYINVVMVQPIAKGASSFCLLLYGSDNRFTAVDVKKRWKYIENELQKVGITVLTISSDSDARYNAAMRELSTLGENSCVAEWFSCRQNASPAFLVQDTVHIITKMRNFILRTLWAQKKIPFGKRIIDIAHVYVLLYKYSKDKHLLTESVLNPTDRQNFSSAQKMCSVKVTDLLTAGVDRAEATALFLELMRNIMHSFMDPQLSPIQRIRAIWYPVFIMRIWRQYIADNWQFNFKDNFMTTNCYVCIELNAHALILLMHHLKEINRADLFLPELFSSQPCETTFRQFRSLSSIYSTITNCTVKEACARISKIQIQSDIMNATSDEFVYPRFKQKSEHIKIEHFELPSKEEIFAEIEHCQKDAISTAKKFGLIAPRCKIKNYVCKLNSLETKIKATKINYDSTDQREDIALLDLGNIQLKDYTGKMKNPIIDINSPYIELLGDDGEQKIVKKTSLCWLLQEDCPKLSSDRLLRVRQATRNPYSHVRCNTKHKSSKKKKCKRRLARLNKK